LYLNFKNILILKIIYVNDKQAITDALYI